mgnify:CR=1 FL=1
MIIFQNEGLIDENLPLPLLFRQAPATGFQVRPALQAKSWQGDWITNNLAATQIVELLQSERLIVKQPRQENKTFVFDLSVPSAKGFADVVSDFLRALG